MIKDNNSDPRKEIKEKIYEYYKDAPIKKWAAHYVGIDEDTLLRWEKKDADFAGNLRRLKAEYGQRRLKDTKNHEWVLERMFREEFADKNKDVPEINNYINLTDEQLDRVIKSKLSRLHKAGADTTAGGEGTTDKSGPAEVRATTPETGSGD